MDAMDVIRTSLRDVQEAVRADLAELPRDLWWWQPAEGVNHIGFLAWHIVRDEDEVVSYVCGQPQLWVTGGWHTRHGMSDTGQGTGQAPESVADFRYDIDLFMEYAEAAWTRNRELIAELDPAVLEQPSWPGSSANMAQQLEMGCIGHSWGHLGEIRYIHGMQGWRFRE